MNFEYELYLYIYSSFSHIFKILPNFRFALNGKKPYKSVKTNALLIPKLNLFELATPKTKKSYKKNSQLSNDIILRWLVTEAALKRLS